MIMWTFGEAAMAYDMPGLTKGVRALSFKRLDGPHPTPYL